MMDTPPCYDTDGDGGWWAVRGWDRAQRGGRVRSELSRAEGPVTGDRRPRRDRGRGAVGGVRGYRGQRVGLGSLERSRAEGGWVPRRDRGQRRDRGRGAVG